MEKIKRQERAKKAFQAAHIEVDSKDNILASIV